MKKLIENIPNFKELMVKRHDVRYMRQIRGWPYKAKKYTDEEKSNYRAEKRLKNQPKFTVDRINETVSDRWFNQKQIWSLVSEYQIIRNTHRLNREINNEKALEYVRKQKEHSLYKYKQMRQNEILQQQLDLKKEEA